MRRLLLEGLRAPVTLPAPPADAAALRELAGRVDAAGRRRLGRSLVIRQIDAGSCNGCELEIHALANPLYDLERLGFHIAASPRHADVLLVTGPVTRNMATALRRAYDAMPAPKWVVAAGDCAAGCGVFAGTYALAGEGSGAVAAVVPVDLHLRGCPPTPLQLLAGLLALMEVAGGR
jgi:Ni,Fe-hydrogenase III small subunit